MFNEYISALREMHPKNLILFFFLQRKVSKIASTNIQHRKVLSSGTSA
jgi:hypothetical protein